MDKINDLKKLAVATSIMAMATMFSNTAIAEAVVYKDGSAVTPDNPPYGVTVNSSFTGILSLSGFASETCEATFDGNVEVDTNGQTGRINVTGVSLKNTNFLGLCPFIIVDVPFSSYDISASDLIDVSIVEGEVDVTFKDVNFSVCGSPGDIDAVFNNGNIGSSGPTQINSVVSQIFFDNSEINDTGCYLSGTLGVKGGLPNDVDVVNQQP